ncbi:DNA photolyase family protein [Actinidia rufa]|uniref:DNA photolyase family protein n=1 Tax=Actinidia rufa TaxID=165716 RepID=A0A7J0GAY8_9ERIC|nr:DNA photolyase family protein [Actinidia rufa]
MEPNPNASYPGSTLAGVNRIRFLLESLAISTLAYRGSALRTQRGSASLLEGEPYYQALDVEVKNYASAAGIEVFSPVSHTLFNPADISYKSLLGGPLWHHLPLQPFFLRFLPLKMLEVVRYQMFQLPTLQELGYEDTGRIPWNVDDKLLEAWRDARTGFPWIDAIMVQLNLWYPSFGSGVGCIILQGTPLHVF